MRPAGYIFVLSGALLIRQVVAGRAADTPADMRDLAIAFLNADVEGMKTVLSMRGSNVETDSAGSEVATASGSVSTSPNAYAQKVLDLGSKAKGYSLGATGPEYYDCSGLLWRAAKDLGIFTGARFTTKNFADIRKPWTMVSKPASGDIILWENKHMGISLGGDAMYSARSRAKGIGQSTVSGDSGFFGYQPTYWRQIEGPVIPGGNR